ncbi:MAG TPA: phosphate ABC transporter substrate-binding protein PstS [Candidatus Acidoferrum sp.]|nr:phosphate ABC transporter substrate-binding protein PstS [Candidatus Acidoferrum sp.]
MKVPVRFSSVIAQLPLRHCLFPNIYIYLFFVCTLCLYGIPAVAQNATVLVGSGSSVPAPLLSRWTQEYGKRNPNIQMRYLPVGTSEGIKQISHGAGDFSAGESQLTEKERKENNLIELPMVLIGIVPIYNLPEIHQELHLSGEVLAQILLGEVKTWNAPQITKLNPEITLPSLPIRVINRPAGKGSNYVLTDFLSKVNSKFRAQVGVTPSPKWPVGESAERSSDMADKVKSTPGSIGYVEYQYAVKGGISQAAVLNSAGKFVKASSESIGAACKAAEEPRWNHFSASLADAPGADSFPITSFSWIYLRSSSSDSSRAPALQDFLNWIYTDGQQYAVQEGYSELPPPLLAAVRKKVNELR